MGVKLGNSAIILIEKGYLGLKFIALQISHWKKKIKSEAIFNQKLKKGQQIHKTCYPVTRAGIKISRPGKMYRIPGKSGVYCLLLRASD